ncbi:MAG: 3-dehydroquinate synthase, partial [Pseudohongiellaceae bacterium]
MTSGSLQIRKGLLGQLPLPQSPTGRCLLLTDQNVEALLPGSWGSLPRHVIPAGEQSKSWSELEGCLLAMDRAGLDRDGLLIAVGGGVVTDLGGLAASLHRRGIAWHAIPTSLIGQVDAAIGGKTAINLGGGKNTVGTVHLPAQVLIDPVTLATLPRRHLLSGMAEVLKTALIAGQSQTEQALRLGPDDFAQASDAAVAQIQASVATKQALVKVDLYDQGPRRKLNLGHTFGHALE